MKSIKSKILVSMILTVTISLALVGGIACALGYNGTQSILKVSMTETASIASERVSYQLKEYKTVALETGAMPILSAKSTTLEKKQEILQQKVEAYELVRYNLLDKKGHSLIDGKDYSDRAYFKEAMEGKAFVSEPLVSKVTGELTIIVSAPIWKDGIMNGEIDGVVYFVPKETFLNDIVGGLRVSKGGSAYMLDADGNTIAHKNIEAVREQENTIEDAKSDSSLKALAAIEKDMIAGENGFAEYSYGGDDKFSAYSAVPDTNGWSIAITAPVSDFNGASVRGIIVTIVLLIITAIIASLIAIRIAANIGTPIKACAKRLELLSKGDLDAPVPEFKSKDEVGNLVVSTGIIVEGLGMILKDTDYLLDQMGRGNFVVDSKVPERYIGNFEGMLVSMRKIRNKLSDVLMQIHTSSEQISAGASQVSDGAQSLAQGATEQASSIQELAATI